MAPREDDGWTLINWVTYGQEIVISEFGVLYYWQNVDVRCKEEKASLPQY